MIRLSVQCPNCLPWTYLSTTHRCPASWWSNYFTANELSDRAPKKHGGRTVIGLVEAGANGDELRRCREAETKLGPLVLASIARSEVLLQLLIDAIGARREDRVSAVDADILHMANAIAPGVVQVDVHCVAQN